MSRQGSQESSEENSSWILVIHDTGFIMENLCSTAQRLFQMYMCLLHGAL